MTDIFEELITRKDRGWEGAEDDEDEEFNKTKPLSLWSYVPVPTDQQPPKYTQVLVGLRGAGAVLLRALFSQSKLRGTIIHETSERIRQDCSTKPCFMKDTDRNKEVCFVFEQNTTLLVISQLVLKNPFDENSFISFFLDTFDFTNAKSLLCFDTISRSRYYGTSTEYSARSLITSALKSKQKPLAPFLETPSIIEGIAAAFISACEFRLLPCEVLVSIEDTHLLELETIFAFLPFLTVMKTQFEADIDRKEAREAIREELTKLSWRKLHSFYS